MAGIADTTNDIARKIALRVDMMIRVVIKPRPRFIPEKLWLKLASIFIYLERTQPSMKITDGDE